MASPDVHPSKSGRRGQGSAGAAVFAGDGKSRLSSRWLIAVGLTVLAFGLLFFITAFPVRAVESVAGTGHKPLESLAHFEE